MAPLLAEDSGVGGHDVKRLRLGGHYVPRLRLGGHGVTRLRLDGHDMTLAKYLSDDLKSKAQYGPYQIIKDCNLNKSVCAACFKVKCALCSQDQLVIQRFLWLSSQ